MSPARGGVAVVIPAYNSELYIAEAIESVLAQTRPPDELIVVDDGSTDASAEIAARFAAVTLIRQANRGACLARNAGFATTQCEFVVFHDADDRLLPGAIETGLAAIEARPACAFVYGFNRSIRADGSLVPQPPPRPVTDASYLRTLEGQTLVPPGSALFRRDAVEAAGGFRDGTFPTEDYDLYLRVSRQGEIHCHNQVVVEYRSHGANATSGGSVRTLRSALRALDAQREFVRGKPELERALAQGRRHWGRIFGPRIGFEVFEQLRRGRIARSLDALALSLRFYPRGLLEAARHLARPRALG